MSDKDLLDGKIKSGFLTKVEQEILDEMKRVVPYLKGKNASKLELNGKQFRIFKGICSKAKKYPAYDYAKDINPEDMEFHGIKVLSTEKRKRYGSSDLVDAFADV